MLELKQLTKIYRTKAGETRALDGVSTTFPESGLMFLLGKSGSGKSTMLNLIGGLDEPTDGEIVVMGKSSKNFSESDFDSYRNTFVGFVFQEYNVLEEFTVEENVALALELQGNTKSGDKVQNILDEVELHEFAKRKPNTLSGGQKQRVAIARALVKEPKIILADEPTGALDSETGKQVFETLKKLSETRLVIVVSHDREFAETYGDRIIELKDGKIISDMSRTEGATTPTKKKDVILDKTIFGKIRAYIETSADDKKNYDDFLRASKINDTQDFQPTTPQPLKVYDGSKTNFIRARMPLGKAVKMGASGLKLKPFRLAFTILLAVISFVMFGLLSTMTFYDSNRVLAQSLKESGFEYVAMEKNYEWRVTLNDEFLYGGQIRTRIAPEEVAIYGNDALGAYRINVYGQTNIQVPNIDYYQLSLRYATTAPEGHAFRGKTFQGEYPKNANEIAVSSYLLEVIKNSTFVKLQEDGTKLSTKVIHQASDLIGERIAISSIDATFVVTGVFDSGSIPNRFEPLKSKNYTQNYDLLRSSYYSYLQSSVHSLVLVSDSFYKEFGSVLGDNYYNDLNYFSSSRNRYDFRMPASLGKESLFGNGGTYYIQAYTSDPDALQRPISFFGEPKDTLGEREVILPLGAIATYYQFLVDENATETEREAYEIFVSACEAFEYGRMASIDEINEMKAIIIDYISARPMETLTLIQNDMENRTVTVVGVYYGSFDYQDGIYCSQEFYEASEPSIRQQTNYRPIENAVYDFVLLPLDRNETSLLNFASTLGERNINPETDVFYTLDNPAFESVEQANELIDLLSTVFLWVGVVMAVFAALLLFNFISVSIANKKKEIGILRAVGARGSDVFKIFFAESGIIVGICIVLALIGTIVITAVLNSVLYYELGMFVSLFVFGPISVVMMIGIAILVALLATFLPVYLAAKKKPVESIRAL